MKHDKYWLALQAALGQGAMLKPMLDTFGGAKEILELSEAQRMSSGLFTPKQSKKLEQADFSAAERVTLQCKEHDWRICTYEDNAFPAGLREIPNPPAALFCWGAMPDFENRLSVGIVGSREASRYALKATDYLGYVIAGCNGIVVSGGALGVDSASHMAALRAGGTTVAVLGCGFGTKYLMQFQPMRQQIAQTGAVVSEYPPYTEINRSSFPLRNRLIAALSDGVIVVEAALKSGSLITAKRAAEQGRDVFAVPGSIVSYAYAGTNKLIEDGAMAALSPQMVLGYYADKYPSIDFSRLVTLGEWQAAAAPANAANLPSTEKAKERSVPDQSDVQQATLRKHEALAENLTPELRTIYNSLTVDCQHIDIIIGKTGMAGSAVISALTQLELMGLASAASGKRYRKD